MPFPQSTLEEIIESERQMLVAAQDRYGKYFTHARECTFYLANCVTSVKPDRMIFGRFFAMMKKHQTLALLSTLRLHATQAQMNLRQVVEAGAAAAFAIANTETCHFANVDQYDILDPTLELTKKRYQWLGQYYPAQSQRIKETKNQINQSGAHANIVSTSSTFRMVDTGGQFATLFFDIEDEHYVKIDLWQGAGIALTMMNLFHSVNTGLGVIVFPADFLDSIRAMEQENNSLRDEMMQTDRAKKAMKKIALRNLPPATSKK